MQKYYWKPLNSAREPYSKKKPQTTTNVLFSQVAGYVCQILQAP